MSAAQDALIKYLENASESVLSFYSSYKEKKAIRVTKRLDFSDSIVTEYLDKKVMTPEKIYAHCLERDISIFTNPIII